MFHVKRLARICIFTSLMVCLLLPATSGTLLAQPTNQVIIEVNNPTEDDDYLCWSPVQARMRLAAPQSTPAVVQLNSVSAANGGAVWFQPDDATVGSWPSLATFAPSATISLTLPGDGAWVNFWVAGQRASTGSKDVRVVATDDAGNELGSLPVMVRVRKNATRLSAVEIQQFLWALRTIHDLDNGGANSQLTKYVDAHLEAFNMGIHGSDAGAPLFLAWHRAFLLNLERELQAVDPRVTLPYWEFHLPAEEIFTLDFMDIVPETPGVPGAFLVNFAATNPLRGWQMADGEGALVRGRNGALAAPYPANRLDLIFNNAANPDNSNYSWINPILEGAYHNFAHGFINGWLNTGSSPRDPLFFLLHANVDRVWAHLQARLNLTDPTDINAYSAPGTYEQALAGALLFRKGSYAEDAMWPWTNSGGDQGTPDPFDDWPSVAYPLPNAPGAGGPALPPTPAEMVDYLDVAGQGDAHGACYDDIDFSGNPIPDIESAE